MEFGGRYKFTDKAYKLAESDLEDVEGLSERSPDRPHRHRAGHADESAGAAQYEPVDLLDRKLKRGDLTVQLVIWQLSGATPDEDSNETR